VSEPLLILVLQAGSLVLGEQIWVIIRNQRSTFNLFFQRKRFVLGVIGHLVLLFERFEPLRRDCFCGNRPTAFDIQRLDVEAVMVLNR